MSYLNRTIINHQEAWKELEQFIQEEYKYHTHYGARFEVEFIEGFMIEMHSLKKKWGLG